MRPLKVILGKKSYCQSRMPRLSQNCGRGGERGVEERQRLTVQQQQWLVEGRLAPPSCADARCACENAQWRNMCGAQAAEPPLLERPTLAIRWPGVVTGPCGAGCPLAVRTAAIPRVKGSVVPMAAMIVPTLARTHASKICGGELAQKDDSNALPGRTAKRELLLCTRFQPSPSAAVRGAISWGINELPGGKNSGMRAC